MKKKITFIINSLEGGGTEKHLLGLVKFLKKSYDICIFAFKGGRLIKSFKEEKIDVEIPKHKKSSIFVFIKFLFTTNTDLYHFFLPKSYIIGSLMTYFSSKKKIMSRRSLNNYHMKYFNISLYVEKFLHKRTDLILANSKAIKDQLIEKEGVKEKKVFVIKNFFKPSEKKINLKKKLGIKNSVKLFGLIANLIPYKNHLHIIKACANLKSINWMLLFIGENRNNYKYKLEKEIKKLGLEKNIIFTGFLDNVEMCLKDLEFVVNVSLEEGSSNSLLQAIAYGVPILASNIETNKEFVEHEKNGFLFEKGNIEDLTKYLDKFLKLNDLSKMRIKSKQIFKNRFNFQTSVDNYLDIYKRLID